MSLNTKSKDNNKITNKADIPPLSEKINLYILPILLGASICFSVIYALYKDMAIPYTLLFLGLECVLFGFFDILQRKKAVGGLIYTVILIVLVGISIQLTYIGAVRAGNPRAPMLWFYGLLDPEDKQPLFLNAVFIGGGFFIISILYYFTQVRYRTLGVMLCILFPFVIYSRHVATMPELMATVIIMLYLAVVVHNRRTDPSQQQRKRTMMKIDRSYIISIAIFVSITGTVTMMIKRPVYLSKLERNSNYFDYALSDEAGTGGQSLESTSETSSPRYGARDYTGDPLFYFDTNGNEEVYYLRRQPYITFNGDVWEIDHNTYRSRFFYTSKYPEYSTDDILSDMQILLDESGTETDIKPEIYITVKEGRVYSDTFAPEYLPAPFGVITDNVRARFVKYRKYPQSAVIRTDSYTDGDSILDESFEFYDQTAELYDYAEQLGFNAEEYIEFLLQQDGSEAAERLLEDYINAQEAYSDKSNISDSVAALAEQITEGAYSDIEKATALEQYFELNGYVYDEDYEPDDKSIDYFIFEGKTGVCTSYATAMTLMARSLGLPSRYVEGFAAFEKSEDNAFLIRDKHAHAFVEVYISGVGWLTFDPTVSGYMEISEEESNNYFAALLRLLSRFLIVILVALFVIFTWLQDRLLECVFRIRQLFRNPKQQTLELYANIIKLINFSSNDDYSSYTVKMLREYINSSRGAAPEQILQLFERTAFGGYEPTSEEYHNAYLEYKKCYKYLRKIPREPQIT